MDMTLNAFTLYFLTGLQLGSIFVLIALGLTLIFGTLGVVNFAHGALYLIAIYLAVSINNALGFGLALILVPPILFVFGVLMERGLIQRFYDRPHTDQILVTFGLAIVIQELLKWIFGANNIPFAIPSWGNGIIMLHEHLPFLEGFVVYPKWRLILVVVTIVTVAAVFALLHLTRFGLVIRAGMRDAEMMQFLGVNINRRFMIVFGLGSMIAGIAGVFGGPVTQVSPEVGMQLLVPSFLVVVIGGMGSLGGAVLAGILIGMAQSFTAPYINLNTVIIYLITVIILIVRPRGLMGAKGVFE